MSGDQFISFASSKALTSFIAYTITDLDVSLHGVAILSIIVTWLS